MAEVDSRMRDLMDIGISHDKSLEGLVNDLAASCTDVPRLKGLARFLGYGGMDEYELAARLYDRCLDVHLTALGTARMLWRDRTASIAQSFRGWCRFYYDTMNADSSVYQPEGLCLLGTGLGRFTRHAIRARSGATQCHSESAVGPSWQNAKY